MKPRILSGRFEAGKYFRCGENVTIDVAEDVVVGDRCVLGDNTYISGRKARIGDDFYGYSHWGKRLEVGLGRIDEKYASFQVGNRCTLHDNKIDLAREVVLGDDVGLSPEVTIYTHYYWRSPLCGFPMRYGRVEIRDGCIVGYRATILPDSLLHQNVVVAAGAVVSGYLYPNNVYGGVPARHIKDIEKRSYDDRKKIVGQIVAKYLDSCLYRGFEITIHNIYPELRVGGLFLNVEEMTVYGDEDEYTDDFRWHLFRHGLRFYTQRPFQQIPSMKRSKE